MKRFLYFLVLGSSLLLLLSACDKIEKDQYWVYGGTRGEWYDTQEEIPAVQRCFVEKYTGVRCVNCPQADVVLHEALEKYGDRLTVVAVHSGLFGRPIGSDPNLRTEDGETMFKYFGVETFGQPAGLLMRGKNGDNWDLFIPTTNFDSKIDAVLAQEPAVAIQLKAQPSDDENAWWDADISVAFLKEVSDSLTVTLMVMEDKIYTAQESSGKARLENYEQNHVLRQCITNIWGYDVDADGKAGTKRTVRLTFLTDPDWNLENCHLVAFISNRDTKKVLNVAQCDLK